jgi:hypothetical protein
VVKVAFIQKIIEPNLVAYYVEKNRFLLCSWLPTGTYHENVAIIWIYFSSKSGLFGPFFP